jgi:hypothetical protein
MGTGVRSFFFLDSSKGAAAVRRRLGRRDADRLSTTKGKREEKLAAP